MVCDLHAISAALDLVGCCSSPDGPLTTINGVINLVEHIYSGAYAPWLQACSYFAPPKYAIAPCRTSGGLIGRRNRDENNDNGNIIGVSWGVRCWTSNILLFSLSSSEGFLLSSRTSVANFWRVLGRSSLQLTIDNYDDGDHPHTRHVHSGSL